MCWDTLEKMLCELGFVYDEMSDSGDWIIYESEEYRLYLHAEEENLYKVEKK